MSPLRSPAADRRPEARASRPMRALLSLAVLGALCGLLLAGVHALTEERIAANRDAHRWRIAFELLGGAFPTAGLGWRNDRLQLADGRLLLRSSRPGYAGDIELLAAFQGEGERRRRLLGARVTAHRETPGLGDFVELARSPWMRQFSQRPPEAVDGVTGATITSEAVKRGVADLLQRANSP